MYTDTNNTGIKKIFTYFLSRDHYQMSLWIFCRLSIRNILILYWGESMNTIATMVTWFNSKTKWYKRMCGVIDSVSFSITIFLIHPCLEKTFGLTFLPRKDIQCILMDGIYGMIWDHFWIFWFTPFQVNWGQRRPRG